MARLRQRIAVFFLVALAVTLGVVGISSLAVAQPAESIETRVAMLEEAVLQLQASLGDPEMGIDMRGYLTYLRSEANSYRAALEEDRDHFLSLAQTAAWVIGAVGTILLTYMSILLGKSIREARENVQLRMYEKIDQEFGPKLMRAVGDIMGGLTDEGREALRTLVERERRVRRSKVLVVADADQLDEMKNAVRHLGEHGVVVESRPVDDDFEAWFAEQAAGVHLVAYRYSVDAGSETDQQFGHIVRALQRLGRETPLVIYVPIGRIEGRDQELYDEYWPVDRAQAAGTLSRTIRQALKDHPLKNAEADGAAGKKRAKKA